MFISDWVKSVIDVFKKEEIQPKDGKEITKVGDVAVYWNGTCLFFIAGMTIDADGSPRAYHPLKDKGLDYLESAGYPGNWWGIATDSSGQPYIQKSNDPCPGFYISTTAYENKELPVNDPYRYVDSETVPYVVLPAHIKNMVAPKFLGCKCVVKNLTNGKIADAVLADLGPKNHIGEGSIALANLLNIPSSPKRGGINKKCIMYMIYPGIRANINGKFYKL